jgi:hypothetical protein
MADRMARRLRTVWINKHDPMLIDTKLPEPRCGLRREEFDANFLIMFTTRTRKTVAFNGLFLGLVVVVALVNGTVAS